ncbi:hypothetical protein [Luteolibacter luteus]|uniref:Sulfotransferase family protein n=1 Tax=Luteolibacter luteus TaxID=2728835 RepID=A0A858RNG5_9BACT|nr:hypothetical protein [Luteolibacter luteus]QJE98141.1 hypothetical protein HHL09_20915 [Luteolibacter luteus]
MDLDPVTTPDWFPMELDAVSRELTWLHVPGGKFHEPFFEDSVRLHRRSTPFIKTPLTVLSQSNPDAPAPAAIFFHSSRCGSTLVMQLLSHVTGCRTLSEPPVLDTLLHLEGADDALVTGLLRAFAKPLNGVAPKLFLKTDCWHLPQLGRLKRLFPETPRYFIYREPDAILRSHRRMRGSQMVPGIVDSRHFDIDPASVNPADLDGYTEQVLAGIFRQAATIVEEGGLKPIAYSELPQFVWETLGPELGISSEDWTEAKQRSHFDSKGPHVPHQPAAQEFTTSIPDCLARDHARLEAVRGRFR